MMIKVEITKVASQMDKYVYVGWNLAKNRPLAMEIGLKKGPLRHTPS